MTNARICPIFNKYCYGPECEWWVNEEDKYENKIRMCSIRLIALKKNE